MLHDLMWAFYWIDVLSSISRNFILIPISGAICGVAVSIIRDHEKNGPTLKSAMLGFIPGVVVAFALNFIPDKSTMYLMLGVRTTDTVINSDTGQKVQKILNEKLDDYLNQLVEDKKRKK